MNFYLTSKELASALIKAHLRGVKVRVINDATSARNEYTKHEALRAAGIDVKSVRPIYKFQVPVPALTCTNQTRELCTIRHQTRRLLI